jgi:hypothetical protein
MIKMPKMARNESDEIKECSDFVVAVSAVTIRHLRVVDHLMVVEV